MSLRDAMTFIERYGLLGEVGPFRTEQGLKRDRISRLVSRGIFSSDFETRRLALKVLLALWIPLRAHVQYELSDKLSSRVTVSRFDAESHRLLVLGGFGILMLIPVLGTSFFLNRMDFGAASSYLGLLGALGAGIATGASLLWSRDETRWREPRRAIVFLAYGLVIGASLLITTGYLGSDIRTLSSDLQNRLHSKDTLRLWSVIGIASTQAALIGWIFLMRKRADILRWLIKVWVAVRIRGLARPEEANRRGRSRLHLEAAIAPILAEMINERPEIINDLAVAEEPVWLERALLVPEVNKNVVGHALKLLRRPDLDMDRKDILFRFLCNSDLCVEEGRPH